MDQHLFREEVLASRRVTQIGGVRLAVPLSHTFLAIFFACTIAAAIIALSIGSYTRREHAIGMLVPQAGLLEVAAGATGVIASLTVNEGDILHPEFRIGSIATDHSTNGAVETGATVLLELHQQQDRLEEDIAGTGSLAQRQAAALRRALSNADEGERVLRGQKDMQARLVASLMATVDRIKPLVARGYLSGLQFQQQEAELISAQVTERNLQHQIIDAQQSRDTTAEQLASLPLTIEARLNEQRRDLARIKQEIAQAELSRAMTITARSGGRVASVLVHVGQPVKPDDIILTLVPNGAALEAQFFVPSRAAGFLKRDATVVLRYRAFPFQKFGTQRGTIAAIGSSAISPPEISRITQQAPPEEPMYRVLVRLDAQTFSTYGRIQALKPGMVVEADIEVERRSLFEWLFEPLFALKQRGSLT